MKWGEENGESLAINYQTQDVVSPKNDRFWEGEQ